MTTRKQREIQRRHELILVKGRGLFLRYGYHSVTMDMIARELEYSKGTIYQHFNCKECIITTLCTNFCTLVYNLLLCVTDEKNLNPRLQMLLIQEAFIILQETCPDDVQLKNLADSQPFSTKVPDELINKSNHIEQQTFVLVVGIVRRAIANKQLRLPGQTTAEDVAIGCWALAHGIFILIHDNSCASTFGLAPAKDLLRINSQLYLDGVGWDTYTLTEKRKQFIQEFSEKFRTMIKDYYPSNTMKLETSK